MRCMERFVLVVEDDEDIARVVRVYLERVGYAVRTVGDGTAGLYEALEGSRRPDLIILDWMLPGTAGPAFMKRLRARRAIPVIMLTAKGEEEDRLTGFEYGVDDYVVKPFSPRELVARVKAVMSRAAVVPTDDRAGASGGRESVGEGGQPGTRPLRFGALHIDSETRLVHLDDREIDLTTREFELLLVLARSPKRVFTRDELLSRIWGEDYVGVDRVVDVHVSNLRAKLAAGAGEDPGTEDRPAAGVGAGDEDFPSAGEDSAAGVAGGDRPVHHPAYIETVRGVGYRFAVEEDD